MGLLPHSLAVLLSKLETWGLIILFALLSTGTVSSYLSPVINFAARGLCLELFAGDSLNKCPLLRGDFGLVGSDSAPSKSRLPSTESSSQGTQI
jgi:hypothetical protein